MEIIENSVKVADTPSWNETENFLNQNGNEETADTNTKEVMETSNNRSEDEENSDEEAEVVQSEFS